MEKDKMLQILGDTHKIINDYDELNKEERSLLIKQELPVMSLESAAVAKILKDKLSDEEFKLVTGYIAKETFESNSAGLQGGYYYVDERDFQKYLNSSTIVVLNKKDNS